jgi:hypothetical protein
MNAQDSHWAQWHRAYEVDGSHLQQRVAIVQRHISAVLDGAADGHVTRVVSLCAGQGRDVIGVLAGRSDAARVVARLVELDPQLVNDARTAIDAARLRAVEVVEADASTTTVADGAVPADLLLLCGIFGNVSDDDIRNTIELAPTLLAPGATVIWTRHRMAPDLTPRIREWFAAAGFDEVAFETPSTDSAQFVGVGVHRLRAAPRPFVPGVRLFTFVGDGRPSPRRDS